MTEYSTFVLGSGDFELSESLTDYKVSTETSDPGRLHYNISALFSFNTPIGHILPFLEAGGTVSFTRDGRLKRLVLETIDGTQGT
jgi:hypothetical protein